MSSNDDKKDALVRKEESPHDRSEKDRSPKDRSRSDSRSPARTRTVIEREVLPRPREFYSLRSATMAFPAIDNHAHPLLKPEHRHAIPFEHLISEAEGDAAKDAVHTLACWRAVRQLKGMYKTFWWGGASWKAIKEERDKMGYERLCRLFLEPCKIQCVLLDDGLGRPEISIPYYEHESLCKARRIVRVEVIAEDILNGIFTNEKFAGHEPSAENLTRLLQNFTNEFRLRLTNLAIHEDVVAFKSVVCYRTGLNVGTVHDEDAVKTSLYNLWRSRFGAIRLEDKALNDFVVRTTLDISSLHELPVQFHTGLGDNDLMLDLASPKHLQPLIKMYPKAIFVLLHSSYPYTREAGYLTSVYSNVYLDFGEIFPFVAAHGQDEVIRQVLELAPTNKIMWSTDGHWFPESFYLGTIQARESLYKVLRQLILAGDLYEEEAVKIAENALFHNANKLYRLNLDPDHSLAWQCNIF